MSISPTRKEGYLDPWSLAMLVPAFLARNLLSGTSRTGRWRCGDPGLALLIAATLLYTVQSLAAFLLQSVPVRVVSFTIRQPSSYVSVRCRAWGLRYLAKCQCLFEV
ncbi:hypothetical protein F5Y05DRAFT_363829, partial [Hypoxylon sp. FL0543]